MGRCRKCGYTEEELVKLMTEAGEASKDDELELGGEDGEEP